MNVWSGYRVFRKNRLFNWAPFLVWGFWVQTIENAVTVVLLPVYVYSVHPLFNKKTKTLFLCPKQSIQQCVNKWKTDNIGYCMWQTRRYSRAPTTDTYKQYRNGNIPKKLSKSSICKQQGNALRDVKKKICAKLQIQTTRNCWDASKSCAKLQIHTQAYTTVPDAWISCETFHMSDVLLNI
jgi:hypothetical protein